MRGRVAFCTKGGVRFSMSSWNVWLRTFETKEVEFCEGRKGEDSKSQRKERAFIVHRDNGQLPLCYSRCQIRQGATNKILATKGPLRQIHNDRRPFLNKMPAAFQGEQMLRSNAAIVALRPRKDQKLKRRDTEREREM